MYTPLAHLPRHNAPYFPPKILHKPLGNEKKNGSVCFMKTFLHNKPPGPNEGLDGRVQMLVVS